MNGELTCGDCGAPMKEYDLYNRDTGESEGSHHVCPNAWMEAHA